ncbi:nuclear transport factor 2 family protein [uncultured Hymenobacter sp.]|uniref:nuclear transport factor 2 family protein n=1 Tax=uncultured Hymenobacter sp. TaxID=170016 RepID=UPI0035CA9BC3
MTILNRAAVVQQYAQAWAEPDAAKLGRLLPNFWTPDSTYEDPNTSPPVRGLAGLIRKIEEYHATSPGAQMLLNSQVEEFNGVGRFHWIQRRADGTTLYGTDFVEFDAQNHLVRVTGFFNHLPLLQH